MEWCPVCCTRHALGEICPGQILATGPERHGSRLSVRTPYGRETFGVLLAPSGEKWRARILTHPNALWCIPGGGGSMKFVGDTPQEAERKAVRYVDVVCARSGFVRDEEPRAGSAAERSRPSEADPAPSRIRKARAVPVRFGPTDPSTEGVTANLSERGLFISTRSPLDPGAAVRLRIDLGPARVPMRGVVVWNRRAPTVGRPVGMGVRLLMPPTVYVSYVQRLP